MMLIGWKFHWAIIMLKFLMSVNRKARKIFIIRSHFYTPITSTFFIFSFYPLLYIKKYGNAICIRPRVPFLSILLSFKKYRQILLIQLFLFFHGYLFMLLLWFLLCEDWRSNYSNLNLFSHAKIIQVPFWRKTHTLFITLNSQHKYGIQQDRSDTEQLPVRTIGMIEQYLHTSFL